MPNELDDFEIDYELDLDGIESDRLEADFSGESIPFFKPKEGDNIIRVLPPLKGQKYPYYRVFLHYGLDVIPTLCPGKQTCPICNYVLSERKPGKKHALQGTRRIFFNIIDRNGTGSPQVYPTGNTFFKDFADHLLDPEWGDVTHPVNGFDILLHRTGTGMQSEYTVRFRRTPTPLAKTREEIQKIMDGRIDLTTIAQEVSLEKMEEMLELWQKRQAKGTKEKIEDEDEDEEEEKSPPPKSESKPEPKREPRRVPRSTNTKPESPTTETKVEKPKPEMKEPELSKKEEPKAISPEKEKVDLTDFEDENEKSEEEDSTDELLKLMDKF